MMNQKTSKTTKSRTLLIFLIVLLVNGITGCITKDEHARLLSEAVQRERASAAVRIQQVQDEADAKLKAVVDERDRERAQNEAELAKLRSEVAKEKFSIAVNSYGAGSRGLPFPEYQSLVASGRLSQTTFWLFLLITFGALGAAGVWLIRDPVAWTCLAKSLVMPVMIYAYMRFLAGVTNTILGVGLVHGALTECALVIGGFTCVLLFDKYVASRRHITLDLLGIATVSLLMMAAAEFFLLNHEALLASTLGLRLSACAPIGVAVFSIAKAVRKSTMRSALNVPNNPPTAPDDFKHLKYRSITDSVNRSGTLIRETVISNTVRRNPD